MRNMWPWDILLCAPTVIDLKVSYCFPGPPSPLKALFFFTYKKLCLFLLRQSHEAGDWQVASLQMSLPQNQQLCHIASNYVWQRPCTNLSAAYFSLSHVNYMVLAWSFPPRQQILLGQSELHGHDGEERMKKNPPRSHTHSLWDASGFSGW